MGSLAFDAKKKKKKKKLQQSLIKPKILNFKKGFPLAMANLSLSVSEHQYKGCM